MRDHERTLKNEYDDITMKTKFILTRFGSTFGTLRFDKKSFCHTLYKFEAYWDYKPTNAIHADSSVVYTNDKILNLSAIEKIDLKSDTIYGSVANGLRQPILFTFVLNKPSRYKVFCEPETIHNKEMNKFVLNTLAFYSEDNKSEEINFNGKTMTFTLQMIKI